ncbi:hypothetical protein M885DRAFT_512291 [Pelagophyceae sp. CCMP2097]|nr:hypothetical protein M885DRAFT_512291 [Pelagophyceae sp. CCMP2097]
MRAIVVIAWLFRLACADDSRAPRNDPHARHKPPPPPPPPPQNPMDPRVHHRIDTRRNAQTEARAPVEAPNLLDVAGAAAVDAAVAAVGAGAPEAREDVHDDTVAAFPGAADDVDISSAAAPAAARTDDPPLPSPQTDDAPTIWQTQPDAALETASPDVQAPPEVAAAGSSEWTAPDVAPEAAAPDVAPEAAAPDVAPEAAAADVVPEVAAAAAPEAAAPEAAKPEEAAAPDAAKPDAAKPDAAKPDAAKPDAGAPPEAVAAAVPEPEPVVQLSSVKPASKSVDEVLRDFHSAVASDVGDAISDDALQAAAHRAAGAALAGGAPAGGGSILGALAEAFESLRASNRIKVTAEAKSVFARVTRETLQLADREVRWDSGQSIDAKAVEERLVGKWRAAASSALGPDARAPVEAARAEAEASFRSAIRSGALQEAYSVAVLKAVGNVFDALKLPTTNQTLLAAKDGALKAAERVAFAASKDEAHSMLIARKAVESRYRGLCQRNQNANAVRSAAALADARLALRRCLASLPVRARMGLVPRAGRVCEADALLAWLELEEIEASLLKSRPNRRDDARGILQQFMRQTASISGSLSGLNISKSDLRSAFEEQCRKAASSLPVDAVDLAECGVASRKIVDAAVSEAHAAPLDWNSFEWVQLSDFDGVVFETAKPLYDQIDSWRSELDQRNHDAKMACAHNALGQIQALTAALRSRQFADPALWGNAPLPAPKKCAEAGDLKLQAKFDDLAIAAREARADARESVRDAHTSVQLATAAALLGRLVVCVCCRRCGCYVIQALLLVILACSLGVNAALLSQDVDLGTPWAAPPVLQVEAVLLALVLLRSLCCCDRTPSPKSSGKPGKAPSSPFPATPMFKRKKDVDHIL